MDKNHELYHHGVRGMKWGVRRYQNKDGTLTTAGKKRYEKEMARLKEEERVLKNKEATKAKMAKLDSKRQEVDARKKALDGDKPSVTKLAPSASARPKIDAHKPISKMTDDELNAVINRMNLEKRYKEAIGSPDGKEKTGRGKKFVADVLEQSGKNLATQSLNLVGAALLNKMVSKTALAKRDEQGNLVDQIFTNNKKKS